MKKLFTTILSTLSMLLGTTSVSAALTQQQENSIIEKYKLKPQIDAIVLDLVGGEANYVTGKDGQRYHLPSFIDEVEEDKLEAKLDELAKKYGIVYPYIAQSNTFYQMFYLYFNTQEDREKLNNVNNKAIYKSIKALEKCVLANTNLCPKPSRIGSSYLTAGYIEPSLKWLNFTADAGDADSAFLLALLHIDKIYIPKDVVKAKKYYKQAFDLYVANKNFSGAKEVDEHYKNTFEDSKGLSY